MDYLMKNTCDFNFNWKNGCCHRIKLEDIYLKQTTIDFFKKMRVHTLKIWYSNLKDDDVVKIAKSITFEKKEEYLLKNTYVKMFQI
jgi:hypothetical protein